MEFSFFKQLSSRPNVKFSGFSTIKSLTEGYVRGSEDDNGHSKREEGALLNGNRGNLRVTEFR